MRTDAVFSLLNFDVDLPLSDLTRKKLDIGPKFFLLILIKKKIYLIEFYVLFDFQTLPVHSFELNFLRTESSSK